MIKQNEFFQLIIHDFLILKKNKFILKILKPDFNSSD